MSPPVFSQGLDDCLCFFVLSFLGFFFFLVACVFNMRVGEEGVNE